MPNPTTRPLALITGASSGIGAAFARRLAADGYGLILHGRRKELLDALAAELAQKHGTRCEVLIADLSEDAGIEAVAKRAASAAPDILINNAGIGAGGKFVDPDLAPKLAMLRVHIDATVRITHAALPAMRQRGSGAIINVASVAGLAPSGGSVLYGASKSFLVFFSESLALTLLGNGIRVQALCPGLTHTDFHSRIGLDYSRIPEFHVAKRGRGRGRIASLPRARPRAVHHRPHQPHDGLALPPPPPFVVYRAYARRHAEI